MTLIDLILDQYERSEKGKKGDMSGNASFRVEEEHRDSIGKAALVQEAKELEREQLLKIRWVRGYYNVDIEKVEYPLSSMSSFYERVKRTPGFQLIGQNIRMVREYYDQIQSTWIRRYTEEEILPKLSRGAYKQDSEDLLKLYQCFLGLDQLDAPIFKRVFSKRFLNNSKTFERELQDKVIRIARRYYEEIEEIDAMEDTQVLSQLYIEEYAQELLVKGSLKLEVMGRRLDTGIFPFGTVLNTQTIKNAKLLDNTQITKVLTIENKANFISEPLEEGTLIIFCHGFFSPLEREFLIRLREKLRAQQVSYYHCGDMDYGGIRIFQYIRNRIFGEVLPYRMDISTFEEYQAYSEPMKKVTLEKLKQLKEPLLQDLIDRMLETGRMLEQEAYL